MIQPLCQIKVEFIWPEIDNFWNPRRFRTTLKLTSAGTRNEAWAGFSPNDDNDYDPQQESYQNSLDYLIRAIIGKCVPKDFTVYDISRFLKDPTAPIVEIKYHYKTGGKFVNPRRAYKPKSKNTTALIPAEITVKTATGEKVRLKLY